MGDLIMHTRAAAPRRRRPALSGNREIRRHVLDEAIFRTALVRERKRSDRSSRPLLLLLARLDDRLAWTPEATRAMAAAVMSVKDGSQVAGWFEDGRTIGLIAPEIEGAIGPFTRNLEWRLRGELERRLGPQAAAVEIAVHANPHPRQRAAEGVLPVDPLLAGDQPSRAYDRIKRVLDVSVSLALLALLSPLLAVIAALVKLKSPGPVLFEQTRVGEGMRPFKMLKFRTMHVNNDHAAHHEFVTAFIKAGPQAQIEGQKNGMFKLANDPRVTRIGRILRKTSLDELPQLWNVVRGDMSLVGPRPPLWYEVDEYQPWHCRRVLEAKPGITGLWQVAGRSRTTFDEMVRLDLRYARRRSLWTDVKILLATPAAVIVGKGAA